MIVAGSRLVIPESCRRQILQDLVAMHQGATKLRQRARLSLYWPGMDRDILVAAQQCSSWTEMMPSNPREPLKPHEEATRPFEQIHADFAAVRGRNFLILVDQFSGLPHVATFQSAGVTARQLIEAVRSFFIGGAGIPVKLWSDNGPPFSSAEFKAFLSDWGVEHGTSSPYHPQSNGIAEAAVKSMKKVIEGCWSKGAFDSDAFAKALLLFRNTPRSGGASPAQKVYGRPVKDSLPAHRRSFAPEWQKQDEILEERAQWAKEIAKDHFNSTAKQLIAFKVGDHVLVQHPTTKRWETTGVVVEIGPNRDYIIKTPAGSALRRNRRMLRRRIPVMPSSLAAACATPADPDSVANRDVQPAEQPGPRRGRPKGSRATRKETSEPPRRSARLKVPTKRYQPE